MFQGRWKADTGMVPDVRVLLWTFCASFPFLETCFQNCVIFSVNDFFWENNFVAVNFIDFSEIFVHIDVCYCFSPLKIIFSDQL